MIRGNRMMTKKNQEMSEGLVQDYEVVDGHWMDDSYSAVMDDAIEKRKACNHPDETDIKTFDEWVQPFLKLDLSGRDLEDGYANYLEGILGRTPTYGEVKRYGKINLLTVEPIEEPEA